MRRPVSLAEVEAWLASHAPLRAARGRPRQGEAPMLPALMVRFAVSRSTAKRLLERMRQEAACAPTPSSQPARTRRA